jgi:hypothetical protein
MDDLVSGFRQGWIAGISAYVSPLRPKDLPARVVYPFGGGDLVSALAVFPDADEFTLISLEPAGDPRGIDSADDAVLGASFRGLERNVARQFKVGHNRTADMAAAAADQLPSQLLFALVALAAHGLEPVSLRYFDLLPTGGLSYLADRGLSACGPVARKETSSCFRNMELAFRPAGSGPAGRVRVLRHFAVDLGDASLRRDPGLLRHLEAKGPVAAMTKAASYLLWDDSFSLIRGYLLRNMVWMISDSTGIPVRHARRAGFVQDVYGRFAGPFLAGVSAREGSDFAELWRSQPLRRLPFSFGYPDRGRHLHLLVTRRPSPGEEPETEGPLSGAASYADAGLGFSVSFSSPVFVREASPGSADWFLRLQNFRFDEGQRSLALDDSSFAVEFLSAPKGAWLSYDRVRAEWAEDRDFKVDGFPCRRLSGYRGQGRRSPFRPDAGIHCPGARRDLFILSTTLARCGAGAMAPACHAAEEILSSVRLAPAVFGR